MKDSSFVFVSESCLQMMHNGERSEGPTVVKHHLRQMKLLVLTINIRPQLRK